MCHQFFIFKVKKIKYLAVRRLMILIEQAYLRERKFLFYSLYRLQEHLKIKHQKKYRLSCC